MCTKTRFRPGSAAEPAGGAYEVTTLPRTPSRLGMGYLPHSLFIDAFVVSYSISAIGSPNKIPGYQ